MIVLALVGSFEEKIQGCAAGYSESTETVVRLFRQTFYSKILSAI
jgi:hypothetical protein